MLVAEVRTKSNKVMVARKERMHHRNGAGYKRKQESNYLSIKLWPDAKVSEKEKSKNVEGRSAHHVARNVDRNGRVTAFWTW